MHDLHVWSLGSQSRALACHVRIEDIPPSESQCILLHLQKLLSREFHIAHSTIQFEHEGCVIREGCVIPMEEFATDCGDHGHHHGHHHPHAH